MYICTYISALRRVGEKEIKNFTRNRVCEKFTNCIAPENGVIFRIREHLRCACFRFDSPRSIRQFNSFKLTICCIRSRVRYGISYDNVAATKKNNAYVASSSYSPPSPGCSHRMYTVPIIHIRLEPKAFAPSYTLKSNLSIAFEFRLIDCRFFVSRVSSVYSRKRPRNSIQHSAIHVKRYVARYTFNTVTYTSTSLKRGQGESGKSRTTKKSQISDFKCIVMERANFSQRKMFTYFIRVEVGWWGNLKKGIGTSRRFRHVESNSSKQT